LGVPVVALFMVSGMDYFLFAGDLRRWGLDETGNTYNGNTMKVTTKGQVTIPVRIRDYLGIAPHSDVDFRITSGTVVLVKHQVSRGTRNRFSALRGILKGPRTTQQWMRETRGN